MSDAVHLQYVGFETKAGAREYMFTLRGPGGKSVEYFVTIPNAAFIEHRVHYQDAPDICSLRLHRELGSQTEHPLSTRFSITDVELAAYEDAHRLKSKPGVSAHRENKEF